MAQEIYIYSSIGEYSAENVNRQFSWAEGEDVNIRIMTRGGYTPAGVAMISKMSAHTGKVKMSVDGDTSSMGAFMLLFADEVEMSDMAELMFHKAAYPSYYTPTKEEKENLDRENKRFRKKMEQRLGDAGSELIEKVFEKDKRNDVYVTAAQAKKYGLVTKIIKLEPSQKAALQESFYKQMLAGEEIPKIKESKKLDSKQVKTRTMEITQEEYDKKIASAVARGVSQERARVAAWVEIGEVDSKAAFDGIQGNEEVSKAVMVRAYMKQGAQEKMDAHEGDNSENADTPPDPKNAEELRAAEVDAEFKKLQKGI